MAVHQWNTSTRQNRSRHLDYRSGSSGAPRPRRNPNGAFYSYGSNPPNYPKWQEFFRKYQPPTLIVWGKNDEIFPAAGATPYLSDLPKAELHLLDTGHFALEEDGDIIAGLMRTFLGRHVPSGR